MNLDQSNIKYCYFHPMIWTNQFDHLDLFQCKNAKKKKGKIDIEGV